MVVHRKALARASSPLPHPVIWDIGGERGPEFVRDGGHEIRLHRATPSSRLTPRKNEVAGGGNHQEPIKPKPATSRLPPQERTTACSRPARRWRRARRRDRLDARGEADHGGCAPREQGRLQGLHAATSAAPPGGVSRQTLTNVRPPTNNRSSRGLLPPPRPHRLDGFGQRAGLPNEAARRRTKAGAVDAERPSESAEVSQRRSRDPGFPSPTGHPLAAPSSSAGDPATGVSPRAANSA